MQKETLEIYEKLIDLRKKIVQRRLAVPNSCFYPMSYLNMQDFLTLKKEDLRTLQLELMTEGLSSLSRSHKHLLYTIERELELLGSMPDRCDTPKHLSPSPEEAYLITEERAKFLKCQNRDNAVMLTLPSNAAEDISFSQILEQETISIVRINTAHDSPKVWKSMADMVKRVNQEKRTSCPIKIYVDMAGPKIRTGAIKKVIEPFRICTKDMHKVIIVPALGNSSHIVYEDERYTSRKAVIAVDETFYADLQNADIVEINDHDRKARFLSVDSWSEEACILKCAKKVEISAQTAIKVQKEKRKYSETFPVNFQKIPEEIRVFEGDTIVLSTKAAFGHLLDGTSYKAIIALQMDKQLFSYLNEQDRVYIDDGKIKLSIIEKTDDTLLCRVERAKANGTVIKEEKGINFPDSFLDIPAITDEDRENFRSVVGFCDIVGVSFTQTDKDIEMMKEMLKENEDIGIVAKIETNKGLQNLPHILASLAAWEKSAVMLARGDLAIEVGFENLAYVQGNILDLCEAAHTPVIYATQILESLMKKNLPSRAEIIDASIAQRTDCVMLNKGTFTKRTIETLEKIILSMQPFFYKHQPLLSKIHEWDGFRDSLKER
ncbi:MAG: pyruvate kinase [Campylobacterota bacterium]|nr:pyruvate kinase [Campylobacterota bacterium]